MRLKRLLTERDIAKLDVEKCTEFTGEDKIDCKMDAYNDYIRDLRKAINSSESESEEESLEKSLKDAKIELRKLMGEN